MTLEEAEQKAANMTALCPDEECGDPVPSYGGGPVNRTRRQMEFIGTEFHLIRIKLYVYVCPVCGAKRKYYTHIFSGFSSDDSWSVREKK